MERFFPKIKKKENEPLEPWEGSGQTGRFLYLDERAAERDQREARRLKEAEKAQRKQEKELERVQRNQEKEAERMNRKIAEAEHRAVAKAEKREQTATAKAEKLEQARAQKFDRAAEAAVEASRRKGKPAPFWARARLGLIVASPPLRGHDDVEQWLASTSAFPDPVPEPMTPQRPMLRRRRRSESSLVPPPPPIPAQWLDSATPSPTAVKTPTRTLTPLPSRTAQFLLADSPPWTPPPLPPHMVRPFLLADSSQEVAPPIPPRSSLRPRMEYLPGVGYVQEYGDRPQPDDPFMSGAAPEETEPGHDHPAPQSRWSATPPPAASSSYSCDTNQGPATSELTPAGRPLRRVVSAGIGQARRLAQKTSQIFRRA